MTFSVPQLIVTNTLIIITLLYFFDPEPIFTTAFPVKKICNKGPFDKHERLHPCSQNPELKCCRNYSVVLCASWYDAKEVLVSDLCCSHCSLPRRQRPMTSAPAAQPAMTGSISLFALPRPTLASNSLPLSHEGQIFSRRGTLRSASVSSAPASSAPHARADTPMPSAQPGASLLSCTHLILSATSVNLICDQLVLNCYA